MRTVSLREVEGVDTEPQSHSSLGDLGAPREQALSSVGLQSMEPQNSRAQRTRELGTLWGFVLSM